MNKSIYRFYYVNGQTEELETSLKYKDDARSDLRIKLINNPTWISAGGKQINLSNVISVEVVGGNEKMKLKPNLNIGS
jgi:hypothetical protein